MIYTSTDIFNNTKNSSYLMALAVTHIIGTLFILDIFRHYVFKGRKFSRRLLLFGGIAGLLPDIDIPLSWVASYVVQNPVNLHGVFTHSIFWPILFVIIGGILHYFDKKKYAYILYVVAAGWFIHLLFDCFFNRYSTFLWPIKFDTKIFCPIGFERLHRVGIDAIILVVWLLHEELSGKIRDYW